MSAEPVVYSAGVQYWAPSSPGDIADRWTILKLKVARCADADKRQACARRLEELVLPRFDETTTGVVNALGRINETLWDLEDAVRASMAQPNTPENQARFLRAARCIPLLNDTRNHLKKRIDEMSGYTDLQDAKVYTRMPPRCASECRA